ncbi:MAG: TetR family transcriptional regulator, partial [Alphaproteobacteria bacterium]|nr:TetR family transcriptional regulator [Alphaproteobacteria bacterium]
MSDGAAPISERSPGRERLLQEAMRLFAERGFDSVTVRDIAAEAGVSVGLINHHYGTKDGLREAVDRRFIEQFEEAISNPPPQSGKTRLADLSDWVDNWIARHQEDWPLTVKYFRRAMLEGSDWGAKIFTQFYEIVRTSIDRMDAQGGVRPDVDRLWLPFLVMYMEIGTLLLDPYVSKVLGRSGFDPDLWKRRHRAYMRLLSFGVSPQRDD